MNKYKVFRSFNSLDEDITNHELVAVEYGKNIDEITKKLVNLVRQDSEALPEYSEKYTAQVYAPEDISQYRKAKRYKYSICAVLFPESSGYTEEPPGKRIEYGVVEESADEQPWPDKINLLKWDEKKYSDFLNYLKTLSDGEYKKFNSRIINDDTVKYIGVRTSELRKIAKIIAKNDYLGFIKFNKHEFYEERALHGFVIGYADIDYNKLIKMMREFIPYLSSWALVDLFVTKFKQVQDNKDEALNEAVKFTQSDNPWEIRLGIIILLNLYVEEKYINKVLEIAAGIRNEHYYVKMGNAWLISECYVKFPDETTKLLKDKKLYPWTQNKAIQKIREAFRVSKENKEFLKTLKVKIKSPSTAR